MNKKIPLARALLYVFISTLLVSGSAIGGWTFHCYQAGNRATNDKYLIRAIVQTGPEKEALPTQYLAELLDLSKDRPMNLYALDLDEAEGRLLASPVIKEASVSRRRRGMLAIDYTVRRPVALVADQTNLALDEEGALFPLYPFFSSQGLPEVVLGSCAPDGALIECLLSQIDQKVVRIDVSRANALSCGRRQIVVELEDVQKRGHLLRLSPENFEEALENYRKLAPRLKGPPGARTVIDLRIPYLAYLSTEDERCLSMR